MTPRWETTKAGERQTVPLTLRARDELLRQRTRVGDSPWCFPSPVTDGPIGVESVREAWKRAVKKAGLPPLRLHDLRHGRTTQLIDLDIAPHKVQRVGRWKHVQSMQRYIHMGADNAADALAAAEAIPGEAGVREIRRR